MALPICGRMHRKGKHMKQVEVFDEEYKRIVKLARKFDCCEASVVEALFDMLKDHDIDIEEEW